MGCASVKEPGSIKTVLLYPPIDYSRLSCESEPQAPDPAVATQEEFAQWAEKVLKAGQDCRTQLAGWRAYILSWENDVDMMDPWFEEGMYDDEVQ